MVRRRDPAFASYCPGELPIWHILQRGQQNRFSLFDFGAGKPKDYGPREFKTKFGGTLANYGRNTRVHAPLGLASS